jgi:hypothetical protein
MGGSPKVSFPGPSASETALQNEQVSLLRDQRDILSKQIREQNLLAPFLYKSAGVKPIFDDKGDIKAFEQIPDELQPLRTSMEKGLLERSNAALKGELPSDPTLLRELGDQEATLREQLRKDLGPGYELGTPGGTRLADFNKRRAELISAGSRGDLTLGEQLGLAREQGNQQSQNVYLQQLLGLAGRNAGGVNAIGQVAAGYQGPLSNMFANRQGQFGANAMNFQFDAYANPFNAVGVQRNLHQGAMAFLSTATVKKDIEPTDRLGESALQKLRDTPVFKWRYQWESGDRPKHIGPILELSPRELLADETHLSVSDYLGLTHAAVKELDQDVRTLRDAVTGGKKR